jgi:hypothetical protein
MADPTMPALPGLRNQLTSEPDLLRSLVEQTVEGDPERAGRLAVWRGLSPTRTPLGTRRVTGASASTAPRRAIALRQLRSLPFVGRGVLLVKQVRRELAGQQFRCSGVRP